MSTLEEKLDEAVKTAFIPKVITGGKGPSDPSQNWLTELPAKTTVLIQKVNDTAFQLGQAVIIYKGKRGILLAIGNDKPELAWVDPNRFCNHYRMFEVLQSAEEADLEEKAREAIDEYDGNRTDQPGVVVDP